MSTAAVVSPRVAEGGRKTERGSYSMPLALKEQIDSAANESGMYASTYLELLLQTRFPEGLPRLVMVSIGKDGTRHEIPLGMLKRVTMQLAAEEGKTVRPTYTFTSDLKASIEQAAEASQLGSASAYLRRLLAQAWPEGLPHFGMAMFDLDDLQLTEGNIAMV
ncbi:hypothetical protein [Leucobacter sp. cx-169]|uniref:hypothetical protein n=1 Tax=Leucobacter sp. cx-169 TaxID=2770549 RepID=UPI00165D9D52|nr:hypothetical protein [Leucobacter sp. cx-169]MBC9927314.1 hypothetical protein [Leucobacter sp. cx-169]